MISECQRSDQLEARDEYFRKCCRYAGLPENQWQNYGLNANDELISLHPPRQGCGALGYQTEAVRQAHLEQQFQVRLGNSLDRCAVYHSSMHPRARVPNTNWWE